MPNGGEPIDLKLWLKKHKEISDPDFRFLIRHSLTHHLRVPLAGINGYLKLLSEGEFKVEEQRIHKALLEAVGKTAESVSDIIALTEAYDKQFTTVNTPPKIVMFEDDSMLSQMYSKKFSMNGFEVKVFKYPPENVVDVVAAERPSLISMNVIMPHMDGFQATQLLKADERTKSIPLVFLTTLGAKEDMERGLALGAVKYIVKAERTPHKVLNEYRKILGMPEMSEYQDKPRKSGEPWHGPSVQNQLDEEASSAKKSWWKKLIK